MQQYFCDLHIHIGEARGKPVKITASRQLDFASIAREAGERKGLDMVGIIDCASPPVIDEIEEHLSNGKMETQPGGGLKFGEDLVIIPGAEVESREQGGGQAHYLAYFPHLEGIKEFSQIMDQYITNINLSSQSTGLTGQEIFSIVDTLGGMFVPAHAFTPYKSFYGNCFDTFREIFTSEEWEKIPALELGLSADSRLAAHLSEVSAKAFLSNSDAHSAPKIAREYNEIHLEKPNFSELKMALKGQKGRKITRNYGLDPRLGKYHRTYCPDCETSFPVSEPVLTCPQCGKEKVVTGVKDRVLSIGTEENVSKHDHPEFIHHIPLLDIPGIGARTLDKLLAVFGTEMNILHQAQFSDLKEVVSASLAEKIIQGREGQAEIKEGGGGNYGQVMG